MPSTQSIVRRLLSRISYSKICRCWRRWTCFAFVEIDIAGDVLLSIGVHFSMSRHAILAATRHHGVNVIDDGNTCLLPKIVGLLRKFRKPESCAAAPTSLCSCRAHIARSIDALFTEASATCRRGRIAASARRDSAASCRHTG